MATPPSAQKLHPTVLDTGTVQIARVYGHALYDAAARANQLEPMLDDYESLVRDVLAPNPVFQRLLGSAIIGRADKAASLRRLFEARIHPILLNYLLVLNDHGRLGLLRPVLEALRTIHDERTGRVPVHVRVAAELNAAEQDALRDRLRGFVGGEPVLRVRVEPELLGGLVVRVGDTVYDASVRTRLRKLRELIHERATHEIQSRRDQFSTAT